MDGNFKTQLQTKKATAKRFRKLERFKEQKLLQVQYTITKLGANLQKFGCRSFSITGDATLLQIITF